MKKFKSPITGHLDIFIIQNEDEFEGKKEYWNEISIHGDPEGLRSMANLLLKLADLDQNKNQRSSDWRERTRTFKAKY